MASGGGAGLPRAGSGRGQRVTSVELCFDLVYVFAVTQLSHLLLEHLTLHGAVQTLMLLLAMWGTHARGARGARPRRHRQPILTRVKPPVWRWRQP